MSRLIIKWIVGFLLFIVFLLLMLWAALYYYVDVNKEPLLEKINTEANRQLQGEIEIGDLSLAFWKDFPNVMLEINDIVIRDSLYPVHQHELLRAEKIFIQANFPTLFSEIAAIEKIRISNASIYIFTDSTEYTNAYALQLKKPQAKDKKESSKEIELAAFGFENITVHIDKVPENKQFDFKIHSLNGTLKNTDSLIYIKAPLKAHIDGLGFLMAKGAFLVDQEVNSALNIEFHKIKKQLKITEQEISIAEEPMLVDMFFDFGMEFPDYEIKIKNEAIPYSTGFSFVNSHIQNKLQLLNLTEPVYVYAYLTGQLGKASLPYIHVDFKTEGNQIETDYGIVDSVSLVGFYDNNWEDDLGYVDSNSVILIEELKGNMLSKIPFVADSVVIHNLRPGQSDIRAHIRSEFNIAAINEFVNKTMLFKKGKASLDIVYSGRLDPKYLDQNKIKGGLKIKDAQLSYLPRAFHFNQVSADLQFKEQDIFLNQLSVQKGQSRLNIKGEIKNVLSAFTDQPGRVKVRTHIYSPFINVADFSSMAGSRSVKSTSSQKQKHRKMAKLNRQLEEALDIANMNLQLKVDKLALKNFVATDVQADIDLLSHVIDLKKIKVSNSGGNLDLKGKIFQHKTNNPFNISGNIQHVNIDEFLTAFDNFGMEAITGDHIKGKFSSYINLDGQFTDQGELLKNTIKGNIDFSLREGALLQFEPFMQIQKYVFKKRGLDSVTFMEIKNNLIVERGKVFIFPMEIRNNLFNLFIKGIFAFEDGTDISLEIPMENPRADNLRILKGEKSRRQRRVFLRAQDGSDGKVHISWDRKQKGAQEIDAKLLLDENGELTEAAFETQKREDKEDDGIVKDGANQEAHEENKIDRTLGKFFRDLKAFYRRTIEDDGRVRDD